jgi:protease-4
MTPVEEVLMANARTLVLGVGCLLFILAGLVIVLVGLGLSSPSLPSEVVLAVRVGGPIPEIVAEDPFVGLGSVQPLSLRELHEALSHAAADERVVGVRLHVDSFQGGFATLQEIRGLIDDLREAGKWTSAYIDTAGEFAPGNGVYWLVSACDEVSMNASGDVNLIGIAARTPFLRGTFDKLEIEPEFPGRGAYKTARFTYTNRDFTPAHREMMEWLVASLMDQMVDSIADRRGMSSDQLRQLIDDGPLLGQESVDAGLIDHLEDWTGFAERIEEKAEGAELVGLRSYLKRASTGSSGPRIAVVTGVGTIVRGSSGKNINPLFGGDMMGSDTIARAFRNARESRGVKAVVFRVDSGGGSAIASEVIRQEMVRTAEQMPVVVSMSNAAASGGYWISCGAQRIVAGPGTMTGSIGVFAGHLDMSGFYSDKLGVTFGHVDQGRNADIYGQLEDWTDEQRAIADRMLDRIYDDFLERVSDARGMTVDEVDAIGQGRVWTGVQALERGLIDEIGGFDAAVAAAKELAGIGPDVTVRLVDYPRLRPWWQEMVQRQYDDEAAVMAFVEDLNEAFRTGVMETPGVLWMPPIFVR